MNWKTYADEYGPKKKVRDSRMGLYETLYDTITAWGEDYDALEFDKFKKVSYNNNVEKKKENVSMFDASNMMNRYFGKIANGMVRMSMNGDMAIKTSNGYKTYDVVTGALVNCDNFVFDIGSEFFFIIPTNKVEAGDVILAANKPHCVIKVEPNRIEALRYEDGSIVTIVPERNVMFGRTYFYGKVVSMFGKVTDDKGMKNMMKYFIMSEMMGKNSSGNGGMNSMLPIMMFMGNNSMEDMFEGMFDFNTDSSEEKKEEN